MKRSTKGKHHPRLPVKAKLFDLINAFRFLGLEIDEAVVTKSLATLDTVLSVYDGILAKNKYLAGDQLTLADLFHVPYGWAAKTAGAKEVFDKYPNVKEWFNRLEARNSWQKLIEEV